MAKRRATTELFKDNWEEDDPADLEDSADQDDSNEGGMKIASKNVLEKRVIKTAKRRMQGSGDDAKKSVFGAFSGFNKAQPASFDFLSKLTNGSNESNSTPSKADSPVTSSLFSNKKISTSPGAGLFSLPTSTATPTKSPFGSPSTLTSSLFGVSSTNTTTASNMFMTSKADSTVVDSPFKIQTVTSSTDNKTDLTKSTTLASSTKFLMPTNNDNVAKSLFSTSSTSPFKAQSATSAAQSTFNIKPESKPIETDKKTDDSKDELKMKYYSKLKGLNESVSDWIKKHVEQTPLCILTPIFKDYEKYLKEIQDEYEGSSKEEKKKSEDKTPTFESKSGFGSVNSKPAGAANVPNTITAAPTLFNVSPSSKSPFTPQNNSSAVTDKPAATFSFGMNASLTNTSSTSTSTSGFTFGTTTSSSQSTIPTSSPFALGTTASSPFSFSTNTNTTANGSAPPFSFGIGNNFSFNNIKQNAAPTEEANKEEEDDTPPKVEYTPVVEDNSVYEKKCKVFVKKDGNFVDKGVGTLYIKKVEESGKHQLLVRANTNLGTILVNLILVSGIPTQRMGKNNVMMVCIPTPDSKPPPTPILIRVKTAEEADEMLATLDKYKT